MNCLTCEDTKHYYYGHRVFCADCEDDFGNIKELLKENKILKGALSKYVNAIENNHALLWNEIFEDFKKALEEIKEIK